MSSRFVGFAAPRPIDEGTPLESSTSAELNRPRNRVIRFEIRRAGESKYNNKANLAASRISERISFGYQVHVFIAMESSKSVVRPDSIAGRVVRAFPNADTDRQPSEKHERFKTFIDLT